MAKEGKHSLYTLSRKTKRKKEVYIEHETMAVMLEYVVYLTWTRMSGRFKRETFPPGRDRTRTELLHMQIDIDSR